MIQFQFPKFNGKNNFEWVSNIWGVVNQWFIVLTNQAQLTQTQKDNLDSKKTKKQKDLKDRLYIY